MLGQSGGDRHFRECGVMVAHLAWDHGAQFESDIFYWRNRRLTRRHGVTL